MIFTRLVLDVSSSPVRFLLSSPQRLHAVVAGAVPECQAGSPRTLWRVDQSRRGVVAYLVSPQAPDLGALRRQCGEAVRWESTDYTPFLDRLAVGQRWVFRLEANPVRSYPAGPGNRGVRRPIYGTEARLEWLRGQGERFGFRLPDQTLGPAAAVTADATRSFGQRRDDRRNVVTLNSVRFDGLLEVGDPDALRAGLTRGIGKAKGYGCGLLTLAPPG